jgi:hypothetical protein
MTTVTSGESLYVTAGQVSSGVIVLSGGDITVISGGEISNTLDDGGVGAVSSGGIAIGTTVLSGGVARQL